MPSRDRMGDRADAAPRDGGAFPELAGMEPIRKENLLFRELSDKRLQRLSEYESRIPAGQA